MVNPFGAVVRVLIFSMSSISLFVGCSASDPQTPGPVSVEASPSPTPDALRSSISGTSPVVANGTSQSLVTVVLRTAQDEPVPGVVPQFVATNTQSRNQYGDCTPTDSTGVATCALSSTYAESKLLEIVSPVARSGGVVDFTSGGMNLVVPIEMIDYGVSSNTSATVFDRTTTNLDTADYDGTSVNYFFEVVAVNSNSSKAYDVSLVDESGATQAVIRVPSSTTTARIFQISFTPHEGAHPYRVALAGTSSRDQLKVHAGRIIVDQQQATQTRVYIPLVSAGYGSSSRSSAAAVDSTNSTSFTQGASQYYSIWKYDPFAFSDWASDEPLALEAVLSSSNSSGTAHFALFNKNVNSLIVESTLSSSGSQPRWVRKSFGTNVSGMDALDLMEARVRSENSGNTARVHRAGLSVRLVNLTRMQSWHRIAGQRSTASSAWIETQRVWSSLLGLSRPQVYFEAVGSSTTSGGSRVELYDHGENDFGNSGAELIAESALEMPSASRSWVRSGDLFSRLKGSGNRLILRHQRISGTAQLSSGFVVIASEQ